MAPPLACSSVDPPRPHSETDYQKMQRAPQESKAEEQEETAAAAAAATIDLEQQQLVLLFCARHLYCCRRASVADSDSEQAL